MAATVWKGYVSFGLISIPVRLYTAARNERVSFHQIHKVCDTRIKQHLYCPTCDRDVDRSEIVKGYEVEKNAYVVVPDEEIKKVAPPSTDTMEINEFVKLGEVDPIYYDMSYYVVPEEPGRRAYQLLLETMQQSGYAAVAKIGMHQREYIAVIRPRDKGLALHTMFYPNEVRAVPEWEHIKESTVRPQEVDLAKRLVESLAAPFDPEKYHDEYRQRLLELVERKREGAEVKETPHRRVAPVIDLMAALQQSLAKHDRKPAAKQAAANSKRRKKAS